MELFYPSLLGFLVIFVSLTLHFGFNMPQKNSKNLPPGRTGLPLIGETLEFFSGGRKGHPEKFIFDRIAKHSSYVFRTSLLCSPTIFFCGSAGNKFLFSNHNKLIQVWYPSSVDKLFGRSTKIGSKELLHSFLNPEALHRYIGVINQITQRHFASDWENKDQVTVFSLTKRYSFQLACRLLLSVEDANHVAKFQDPFGVLMAGMWSIPVNFPGTPFNRALKASTILRKEFVAIIKQRKIDFAQGKAFSTQDIMSRMLFTSDEDGEYLDDADVASKIFGLLFSSYETLSSFCATLVMYLGEMPDIYEGVYKEQMEIASSKSEGELLDWKDLNKMRYSWNVVREVMRHAPLGHGGFREAITDFEYDGFSIPKGYKAFWSMQSTHKNPEYFPEPFKFDPSRFDGSGPAPYTFVPFGGGPRICPGKEYARLVILVFVHHLVKRFKWGKVISDEKLVVDSFSKPEKGLPIYLYPHDKVNQKIASK